MKIDKVVVGDLRCNCYILSINNECIVIDPGDEYEKIKEVIGNKKNKRMINVWIKRLF